MSWIQVIEEHAAEGELEEVYADIADRRGKVSNIMRVHSLNPEAMDAHMQLYMAVMFQRSGLSREEREIIATAVSVANQCPYCIQHHSEALNKYWRDDARLDAFIKHPHLFEEFDERQRVLVDYALLLTKKPDEVDETTVETLRDIGLDDEQILSVNLVTSYFNFVNRVALGLGVEFTAQEAEGYAY